MSNYLPIPPRVWSRVENPCAYNLLPNNVKTAYIPLTNKTVSLAQAHYDDQLLYKGNILQHRGNSAQLTKRQKYSQLAKGYGPNRTKVFATQSQTYTNPNTTGLARVNTTTSSFPNEIVGAPNNISGPYQYDVPNPDGCSSTNLKDGGTLVCGTYQDPCTGTIIKTGATSAGIYNPTYCSDVPGPPIELYWNKKVQPWFPKQRLNMNNSTSKWPEGYKDFVSAVKPVAPIISLYETTDYIQVSWALSNLCYPLAGFNVYINDSLYISFDNVPTNLYFYNIDKNSVKDFNKVLVYNNFKKTVPRRNFSTNTHLKDSFTAECECCDEYITKLETKSTIYVTAKASIIINNSSTSNRMTESLTSNVLGFSTIKTIANTIDCAFFNDLFKNNAVVQINTYLKYYNDNLNVNTGTYIDLDTYNNVNTDLETFKRKFSKDCCFYGILEVYTKLWKGLWITFNQNYAFYDLSSNSARWHNDSMILNDIDKLKDYLKTLQESSYFTDISVKSTLATLKPRYILYHKLYGMPANLDYDPEKMYLVDKKLLES